MNAVKAYIETALRIAEQEYLQSGKAQADYAQLSAVIVGLKIALDQFLNEY